MAIYTFKNKQISIVSRTQFSMEGIQERTDLQSALRDNIHVISPDTLVISEEFAEWTEGARRIDLLAIDKQANLVVIELKRDEKGSHMELQALRYAAMVSTMTFKKAVEIYEQYLNKRNIQKDAEKEILTFLKWDDPLEEQFPTDIRIVLASGDFSKELTTTVMWLNNRDLDIRCVRLRPYKHEGEILLNIEQIIPLPEAAAYMVEVRKHAEAQRDSAKLQSPLVRQIRDRCKMEGFTHSPALPSARVIQGWMRDYGEGKELQDLVGRHIRYWTVKRANPLFSHEEIKAAAYGESENLNTPENL
jgi:hypothetical protein